MLTWRKQDIRPISRPVAAQRVSSAVEPSQSAFSYQAMSDWYVRPAIILTSFTLFCGLMYNAANLLWQTLDQPIRTLSVLGNTEYLDRNRVINKLAVEMQNSAQMSSVLSMDIHQLQELAVEEPWVNGVAIKRHWPPAIKIHVEEQVPVAKWGDRGLLNHQGDIFWPEQTVELAHLPRLNGPSTDTARVMDQYYTFSQFFKGSEQLMAGVTLQARGAWTLLLANNIEIELGREKVLPRLRRFLELYKGHLEDKADSILRIDVRYTNGVAVQWRAPENQQKTESN